MSRATAMHTSGMHSAHGQPMTADARAVVEWLEAFAAAVRAQDYGRGRELFAGDVVAFGTRAAVAAGRDVLEAAQWRHVWPTTRGFAFDLPGLACGIDGDTAWAAVPWSSQGRRPDGTWFDRAGRATFVLRRDGRRWLAVHSHHSLNPTPTQP